MADERTVALLGGHASGKTTYLGALGDGLSAGHSKHVRMRGSPIDARALMRLQEPLTRGEYPQRTKEERHRLRLPLIAQPLPGAVVPFDLDIGDYDGEEVERLFTERDSGFSDEWRERAKAAGLILFIRPGTHLELPPIVRSAPTEVERWAAVTNANEAAVSASVASGPKAHFGYGITAHDELTLPAGPRDAVKVPNTLALIEVLQFLRHVRGLSPAERPAGFRVAVLIAMWDSLDPGTSARGPTRYLVDHLALLNDFLWSNYRSEDVLCFGLSSTGGDLKDAKHRARYLDDPHGFVAWSGAGGANNTSLDLTLPLRWTLFGDSVLAVDDSGEAEAISGRP